jgi:poly-gamma-glutamate synthesis protein (capsule biosynthesis protein)
MRAPLWLNPRMRRRDFLLRSAGLLGGLGLAREVLAQSGETMPAPAAADDTLRYVAPAPADSAAAAIPSVRLAVGGDTTPGYNLEAHFDEQIAAGVDREVLWPLYFSGIRSELEAADLAIVNLECTLTERGEKLPKNFNFRARPELVQILREGSVDVVTLANNHMSDYGPEGVDDTITVLDAAGIRHFGAGANLGAARRPLIVERNGLKLGFLGYYFQAGEDMIEPREVYATEKRHGVAGCYKSLGCIRKMVREDVSKLVPQVDLAIPYFHWGWEGHYEVRDYQIELAHLCVDLGCRAVFGCHPHRLQGIEVYHGAPIFYSLGNFVYGGNKDPQDKLSLIARVKLAKAGVEADVVPIQITRWPEAPFQPFVLEGAEREQALVRIAELSAGLPDTLPQLWTASGAAR